MEDLRAKNVQMETDLNRLTEEVREVNRRQEESNKRWDEMLKQTEEGNRGMEGRLAALVTNQVKQVNKGMEEQISSLAALVERSFKSRNGREGLFERGASSNVGDSGGHRHNRREWYEDLIEPETLEEEEYERGRNYLRPRDHAGNDHRGNQPCNLPKVDFPHFDGEDPVNWLMECNYYFDMYQVADLYKSRLAILHFSKEVQEWYRGIQRGQYLMPWTVLVEEVFKKFKDGKKLHPIEEFKRCHQTHKVEEYIKQFEKVRSRVLLVTSSFSEEDFKVGFICGLKEELRGMVKMFKPSSLSDAYEYAQQYEEALDSQQKRIKPVNKPTTFQNYPSWKKTPVETKKEGDTSNLPLKSWHNNNPQKSTTYEQRKALGLCHYCNEKYYPGHRCANRAVNVIAEQEGYTVEEELSDDEVREEEREEEMEQAVVSMYAVSDKKKISAMRFKGQIGKIPVCALLDSGSTHSFINPEVINSLQLTINQTNPMVVMVANGSKMITDTKCESLHFSIQGVEFTKDVRLLAIQGYDMILGVDWLESLGPTTIDWKKGTLEFKKEGKLVTLQVKTEKAEVKMIHGKLNMAKEVEQGHDIVVAHLFNVRDGTENHSCVDHRLKEILEEYADIFKEPKELPPKREVDHQIPIIPGAKPINLRPYRYSYF